MLLSLTAFVFRQVSHSIALTSTPNQNVLRCNSAAAMGFTKPSENSRRLWLSEIPCWKGIPTNIDAAGNPSPILRQQDMLFLPRFAHFPARNGCWKLTLPAGTLLDFLLETATPFLSFSELGFLLKL